MQKQPIVASARVSFGEMGKKQAGTPHSPFREAG